MTQKVLQSSIPKNIKKNTEKISRSGSCIDRTGAAFARLPGMVCKITSHKQQFHSILTEWGILNDNYLASDLEKFSGVVNVSLEKYEEKFKGISLTEAAKLFGLSTGAVNIVVKTCKCKGVCKNDKRCSCWGNNQKCGSHCHLNLKIGKKCKNC